MNYHRQFSTLVFCLIFIPIYTAHPWAHDTPNHLKCKPLAFYRSRADEQHRHQFNRFATSHPLMVRLIYFTPSNRPFRAEVPSGMDALIKNAQTFYADQMEARRFGRKAFTFEADASGRAIVHHVNGQFPERHYAGANTSLNVETDIEGSFSFQDNVYLIAVDVSDGLINGAGGVGGARGPNGEVAFVPAFGPNFDLTTVVHELGHAFGLQHNFNDDAFIMSYGGSPNMLSALE